VFLVLAAIDLDYQATFETDERQRKPGTRVVRVGTEYT